MRKLTIDTPQYLGKLLDRAVMLGYNRTMAGAKVRPTGVQILEQISTDGFYYGWSAMVAQAYGLGMQMAQREYNKIFNSEE